MKKANYKEGKRSFNICLEDKEQLQEDLKKLGYRVSFHPTSLVVHTYISKDEVQ